MPGAGHPEQRVEPRKPRLTVTTNVQHQQGVWVRARVDRQWRHQGVWKVTGHYYLDALQYFRVFPADDCRLAPSGTSKTEPHHR